MPPRQSKAKGKENNPSGNNKRARWNSACDAILIECLEKERANGRMTSNSSWHNDAWTAAEKALAGTELLSGGIAKSADSCQYRWTLLKKEYGQVKFLRERSGFGWNHSKQLVTADEDVWSALLTTHKNLSKWKNTPFPCYDSMHDLVDGTVATGAGAFHPGAGGCDYTPPTESSESDFDFGPATAANTSQSVIDPSLPGLLDTDNSLDEAFHSNTPAVSATPFTPLQVNGRKRPVDGHYEETSSKCTRKTATSGAIGEMASSVRELATAFQNSTGPTSPERRAAAVKIIEDDGELSENEQLRIFKVIRRDVAVADFVISIQDKGKRTRYIQSELDDL